MNSTILIFTIRCISIVNTFQRINKSVRINKCIVKEIWIFEKIFTPEVLVRSMLRYILSLGKKRMLVILDFCAHVSVSRL